MRNTDTGGREAVIGCGTVLDHLRTAMLAAGWAADVHRFPNPDDIAHLATLEFHPVARVPDVHRSRVDAILRRRTDRLPFLAPAEWALFEPVLRTTVEPAGARIHVLTDDLRAELREASALTESVQRHNTGYQAELDWWTAPFEYGDGIPRSALTSAQESGRVRLNRSFPPAGYGVRRAQVADDEAVILVLSTPQDSYADALRCGETLSAVLLECTLAGLATCPVTHVTEIPAARAVIAELLPEPGVPQVLIRVGRVPEIDDTAPMTPRRSVAETLRIDQP